MNPGCLPRMLMMPLLTYVFKIVCVHFYDGKGGNLFIRLSRFYIFLKEALIYCKIIR